jgi:hypothetical protein
MYALPGATDRVFQHRCSAAKAATAQADLARVDLAGFPVFGSAPIFGQPAVRVSPPILPVAPFLGDRKELLSAVEAPAPTTLTSTAIAAPAAVVVVTSLVGGFEHGCSLPLANLGESASP